MKLTNPDYTNDINFELLEKNIKESELKSSKIITHSEKIEEKVAKQKRRLYWAVFFVHAKFELRQNVSSVDG